MNEAVCLRCGAARDPQARFCASCGASLASAEAPVEVRKTVTALFCDVKGSTTLGERLDPESLHAVMETYFARVGAVLTRHGGTVEKFVGDAVMAVFGVPVVHEDDATRACRAAREVLGAAADLDRQVGLAHGVRFEVRIGVEAGEVLVGDPRRGSTFVAGPAVNTAARLEQAAGSGECLIGPACRAMAGDDVVVEQRPDLRLRGVAAPVPVFRLLDVRDLTDVADRADRPPLVGRTRELQLLTQAFDRAATDRTCHLVTLLGPAGIGKSRVVSELVTQLEPAATVLRGRCLSYGEGVTYWPLVEIVRQAAGLTGAEPEPAARAQLAQHLDGTADAAEVVRTLASVAGLGSAPGSVEDKAWAIQSLLEASARRRPILLVLDDLHWAEPGLLDIVQSLCQWSRDAPILVVACARPELLDERPGWGVGAVNSVSALLEPLRDEEADLLVDRLVGDRTLDGDLRDQVRVRSGGNPLFAEHMVRMLFETDGAEMVGASVTIPPTITALLAARLDRLTADERAVIGPAAIVGEVFYPAAVAEMTGLSADDVRGRSRSLVHKGLLGPSRSDLPGQPALRFGHALVRDAAHDALPKAARAVLHERFARWLDESTDGPAYDDIIGSHLEAAYRNRADLGAVDVATRTIGQEAAGRLAAAGRSLMYADDAAAVVLFQRAEALLPEGGSELWGVQVDLVEALVQTLQLERADELAGRVRDAATAACDRRWAAHARLSLASLRTQTDPEGAGEALRREIDQAQEVFADLEDDLGLARAHQARAAVASLRLDSGMTARELQQAADHADRAGRQRHAQLLRVEALMPLVFGSCPADIGLLESRRLARTATGRFARELAAMAVASFATLLGRTEEAESNKEITEQLAGELRSLNAVMTLTLLGEAELAVGDASEASRLFAGGAERLGAAGESGYFSTAAAMDAHALLALGKHDEARARVTAAIDAAATDDAVSQALASGALGWLAAHDGDRPAAQRHIARAVALLERTDATLDQATVHIAGAEAAILLGDAAEARRHRETAIALYKAKGSPVAVARQEALLER